MLQRTNSVKSIFARFYRPLEIGFFCAGYLGRLITNHCRESVRHSQRPPQVGLVSARLEHCC